MGKLVVAVVFLFVFHFSSQSDFVLENNRQMLQKKGDLQYMLLLDFAVFRVQRTYDSVLVSEGTIVRLSSKPCVAFQTSSCAEPVTNVCKNVRSVYF